MCNTNQSAPNARLCDLIVSPPELLNPSRGLRLNAQYYLKKQVIPALSRCFHLIGADLQSWYGTQS